MHLSLGLAHKCAGDYRRAAEHYHQALSASRSAGWHDAEAAATGNLGILYQFTGQLEQARDHYQRAAELSATTGKSAAQAVALINIGEIDYHLDDPEQAAEAYTAALEIYRALDDQDSTAFALIHLAQVDLAVGRYDDALTRAAQALRRARRNGNWLGAILIVYGRIQLQLQGPDAAQATAGETRALAERTGDRQIQTDALLLQAAITESRAEHLDALTTYRRALAAAEEQSLTHAHLEALLGIARTHNALDHPARARDHLHQAIEIAARSGHRRYQRLAHLEWTRQRHPPQFLSAPASPLP